MTAVVLPFWFDRPPLEALDIAVAAEESGVDELWVGEMMTFDAFALAGAIAQRTLRLSLWVGPLAIGLRDPAALALGISSVSLLGGRPAHLALGASTPIVVSQWHGRPWRDTVAHMREAVPALRQILGAERSRFSGRHVQSEGFRLTAAAPDTRIAVAAFGDKMIDAAAALSDRVVVNLLTPSLVARLKGRIAAAATAAGVAAPPLVAWIPAALDPGPDTFAQLARQLVAYLSPPGYGEMFAEAGFGDLVRLARSGSHPREVMSGIPRELIAAVGAVGDEAAVRAKLDEFRAAGVDVVALVPSTAADPAGRRLMQML